MEDTSIRSLEVLDSRLASVVEQDGVLLVTPQGVRRKTKKRKEIRNILIAKSGGARREVPIQFKKQPRSPYVISLRQIDLLQEARQRHARRPEQAVLATTPLVLPSTVPVESYAAATTDLHCPLLPWLVADQFTPQTFTQAFRAVYGRFDRFFVEMRELRSLLGQILHRIEEREVQVVQEVEDAFRVVETPRFSFARALVAFAGLALLVTLPANAVALYRSVSASKTTAEALGAHALESLNDAKAAKSFPESADALRRASSQFQSLDARLREANALATSLASAVSGKYRSARALAEVGEDASEAGRLLALGLEKVFADPNRRLDERLEVLGAYAQSAGRLLTEAIHTARAVSPNDIPESQRARATQLLKTFETSAQAVREFSELSDLLARVVGKEGLRNYLLLFQNHAELRPTGGFIGSLAEVTIDRGAIKKIRVPSGGPYDLKEMLLARVTPPKPLTLVTNRWQFQDANWFPDFPTSANKLRWFWSKSRQSTVDGVVAVNASVLEKILELTGPIELEKYGKRISAENVLFETQKAVELEYDTTANTPKKFIGDLLARLLDRLKELPKDDWLKLAALVSEAIDRKDIQISFVREEEEALAKHYSWSGRLKESSGDALALIEANIAGQKTDSVITEEVAHHVEISEEGQITDTVTLTRAHTGKKRDLFHGVRNVSYLRVYVPKGSALLSASGFETPPASFFKAADETTAPDPELAAQRETQSVIPDVTMTEEGSRTVFGGWLQLDPGKTQTIRLAYRLPKTLPEMNREYLLLETSQSGRPRRLTTTLAVSPRWSLVWSHGFTPTVNWDRDRTVALLFSPNVKASTSPAAR